MVAVRERLPLPSWSVPAMFAVPPPKSKLPEPDVVTLPVELSSAEQQRLDWRWAQASVGGVEDRGANR